MSGIENRIQIADPSIHSIDEGFSTHNQEKYAGQVGLRDVDFEIDSGEREFFEGWVDRFRFPVAEPVEATALAGYVMLGKTYSWIAYFFHRKLYEWGLYPTLKTAKKMELTTSGGTG